MNRTDFIFGKFGKDFCRKASTFIFPYSNPYCPIIKFAKSNIGPVHSWVVTDLGEKIANFETDFVHNAITNVYEKKT